jgi:hypothetical protein
MKFKILILFVCIFLVGTALSKDVEVIEETYVKEVSPTDQYLTDQSVRRNFLVTAMAGYPVLNSMLDCVVTRSESSGLVHVIEYYADAAKKIRINILITGPEFREYTTSKISVKANHYYYTTINWTSNWKAGVYKVTFVIEVIGGKGGSTLVETYSFIVT